MVNKSEQINLFDIKPAYTDYQVRKWTKKYVEYCEGVYHKRADYTGEYACGFHWCCEDCMRIYFKGCTDCVHTIKKIARQLKIKIDYSDFDFEKLERQICKAYRDSKEGVIYHG